MHFSEMRASHCLCWSEEWEKMLQAWISRKDELGPPSTKYLDLKLTELKWSACDGGSPEKYQDVIDSIQRWIPVLNLLREEVEGDITFHQLLQILEREGGPVFSYLVENAMDSEKGDGKGNPGPGCLLPILLKTVCGHAFWLACQRFSATEDRKRAGLEWIDSMIGGAEILLQEMDLGDRACFLSTAEYRGVKLVGQVLREEMPSHRLDANEAQEKILTFFSLGRFMPTFSHITSFLEESVLPLVKQAREQAKGLAQMLIDHVGSCLSQRAGWEQRGIMLQIQCAIKDDVDVNNDEILGCAVGVRQDWHERIQTVADQMQQQLDLGLKKREDAEKLAQEKWTEGVQIFLGGQVGEAMVDRYRQTWADSVKARWESGCEAAGVGAEALSEVEVVTDMLEELGTGDCEGVDLEWLTRLMGASSEQLKDSERAWVLAAKKLGAFKREKERWEKGREARLENIKSLFKAERVSSDDFIPCNTQFDTQFVLNVLEVTKGEIPSRVVKVLERFVSFALAQREEVDEERFCSYMDQVTQALSVCEDEESVNSLCNSAILCLASHLHYPLAVDRFCNFMQLVFGSFLSSRLGQRIKVTEILCGGKEEIEPLFEGECFGCLPQEVREKVVLGAIFSKRFSRQLNPSSEGYFVLRLIIHCSVLGSPPLGFRKWLEQWMIKVDFPPLDSDEVQKDIQALIGILVKNPRLFCHTNVGYQTAILEAIHSRVTEDNVPHSDQTAASEMSRSEAHRVLRPDWERNHLLRELCQLFPWERMDKLLQGSRSLIDWVNLQEIEREKNRGDVIALCLGALLSLHVLGGRVECIDEEEGVNQMLNAREDCPLGEFINHMYSIKTSSSPEDSDRGVKAQYQEVEKHIRNLLPAFRVCEAWHHGEDMRLKPPGEPGGLPAAEQSIDQASKKGGKGKGDFSSEKSGEEVPVGQLFDFLNFCKNHHPCFVESLLLEKKGEELSQGCLLPTLMRVVCNQGLYLFSESLCNEGGGRSSANGEAIPEWVLSNGWFDRLIDGVTGLLTEMDERDGQIFFRTSEGTIVKNLCEMFEQDLRSKILDRQEAMRRLQAVFRLIHMMPGTVHMHMFLEDCILPLLKEYFFHVIPWKQKDSKGNKMAIDVLWQQERDFVKIAFLCAVEEGSSEVVMKAKECVKQWINVQMEKCFCLIRGGLGRWLFPLPYQEADLNEILHIARNRICQQLNDVLEEKKQTVEEKGRQWDQRMSTLLREKIMQISEPKRKGNAKKGKSGKKAAGELVEKRVQTLLDFARKVVEAQWTFDEAERIYHSLEGKEGKDAIEARHQLYMANTGLATAKSRVRAKGNLPQWIQEWKDLPEKKEWEVATMELNQWQGALKERERKSKQMEETVRSVFQLPREVDFPISCCENWYEKEFALSLLGSVDDTHTFLPLNGIEWLERSLGNALKTGVASEEEFEPYMGWICRGLSRVRCVNFAKDVCSSAICCLASHCDHPEASKWFCRFVESVFDCSLSGCHDQRVEVISALCSEEEWVKPLFERSFFSHLPPPVRRTVAVCTSFHKLSPPSDDSHLALRLIMHCCSSCPDVSILKPLGITRLDLSSLGSDKVQEILEKVIKTLCVEKKRFHRMGFIDRAVLLESISAYLVEQGEAGDLALLSRWRRNADLRLFCQSFLSREMGALTPMSRALITQVISAEQDREAGSSRCDDPFMQSMGMDRFEGEEKNT